MQTNPQHAAPAYAPFETGRDARRRGGLLIAATALDSEIAGTTLLRGTSRYDGLGPGVYSCRDECRGPYTTDFCAFTLYTPPGCTL